MKKHYRHENNCLNCGTILEGKFCHNCGQENLELKESFGHMMNHAVSDYFHFDHQFFHTLKPLLFKPGHLTNEYMAGRRAQYLHPVKMYIFISIVYFLLLFQIGAGGSKVNITAEKPVNTQKTIDSINNQIAKDPYISTEKKKALQKQVLQYTLMGAKFERDNQSKLFKVNGDSTFIQYTNTQSKLPPAKRDGNFIRKLKQKIFSYNEKYGQRAKEEFMDEVKHNIPKMMFVMLPGFALILGITFWKSKKYYVEHLIYALHFHSFIFLFIGMILLVEMVIPASWRVTDWISFLAAIYIIWYVYKSLRTVYRRSKFRTITKMIGMSWVYSFMFMICLTLVLVITAIAA